MLLVSVIQIVNILSHFTEGILIADVRLTDLKKVALDHCFGHHVFSPSCLVRSHGIKNLTSRSENADLVSNYREVVVHEDGHLLLGDRFLKPVSSSSG